MEEGAKVNFDHTNNGGWDNYNSGACYNVTDHPIENTKLTLSIDLVEANYASKETRPGIVIEVYLYKAEDIILSTAISSRLLRSPRRAAR